MMSHPVNSYDWQQISSGSSNAWSFLLKQYMLISANMGRLHLALCTFNSSPHKYQRFTSDCIVTTLHVKILQHGYHSTSFRGLVHRKEPWKLSLNLDWLFEMWSCMPPSGRFDLSWKVWGSCPGRSNAARWIRPSPPGIKQSLLTWKPTLGLT